MKKLFIFLCCTGFIEYAAALEFTPIVVQFSKNVYNASSQNWSIGQRKDGELFFGNNQGLLTFDGSVWETHKMPNEKLVRAIYIDNDDRIYVGSFEEFGYYEKNEAGLYHYSSLSDRLTDYKMQNDEIWRIVKVNNAIVFQSFTSFFSYKDGAVSGKRHPYTFLFFSVYKNTIYTNTDQVGLAYYDVEKDDFLPVPDCPVKSPVVSVLSYDDRQALIVTKSEGLYLYDGNNFQKFRTEVDDLLYNNEINSALISNDGKKIFLGTILNGVTAIDTKGKWQWTLNTENVLQNNTVLNMYCDSAGDLWLALDKGISMVRHDSPIQYIQSFNPSIGSLYSTATMAENLYIATNQGLYHSNNFTKKNISNLQLEEKLKGQVWYLNEFDGQLFCGNNNETVEITPSGIRNVSPVKGGICIKKGVIHGKEVLVEGTYTHLCIYIKDNGKWIFSHSIGEFSNPIRYVEIDFSGTIWASHLHTGLFAIRLLPDLSGIESMNVYTSLSEGQKLSANVFSVHNRVVFTNQEKLYTFDDIHKEIVPFDGLNEQLGHFSRAYRIIPLSNNLYWFVLSEETALVEININSPIRFLDIVRYSDFQNQTVDDYQNIIPISDNECFITLENGLARYTYNNEERKEPTAQIHLKRILAFDSEEGRPELKILSNEERLEIKFEQNNLSFEVFYPDYKRNDNIFYSYKLEGLDKTWSSPSTSSKIGYSYIPSGEYSFKASVVDNSGEILSELSYAFIILPPFYWSNTAKIFYFIAALLLLWLVFLYIDRSFKKKQQKIASELDEQKRKELEKKEQEIIALEKAKLESELTLKSKELAGSTMTLIKKNEILASLKEEIMEQKRSLGSQYPNKYYDRLIRMLDENLSSEDDWVIFQTNFDRIHENFFRNLRIKYPELTSNDLRFCAYLRLNLSSKDIANLMNISLKGVELGRYRIRKKIGLPSTKSLTEFMIEFK